MLASYQFGDTLPVKSKPVASATVIEIGDPVSTVPEVSADNGGADFLGIAMQRSLAGETEPIRVATAATFNVASAPAAYAIGDFVSKVGAVFQASTKAQAMAVVVQDYAAGQTRIDVRLISQKVPSAV